MTTLAARRTLLRALCALCALLVAWQAGAAACRSGPFDATALLAAVNSALGVGL